MLLSRINDIFSEKVTLYEFKKEIQSEVSVYKKRLDKKGASVPILLNEDLNSIVIGRRDVELLCNAYLTNQLDEWDLNYLIEGILLSERIRFDNDKTEDALFSLADPNFFDLVSHKYIESVMRDLSV